jgi:two-component system, NtrC family, sensor kinase
VARSSSPQRLAAENKDLRARLERSEESVREILSGDSDALFVPGANGAQLFTLKGADQSYRTLIENMSEGALTLTPEGLILYANRCFALMLATPLERVIGSEIHGWVAPESRQVLQALLQKDQVANRSEELLLAAADGTQVPVYLSVSPLRLDKMPDSFCMVATDLTEQKRNEAILAAEEFARAILEQAADAIVICDRAGRIIRASKQAQVFGGKNAIGRLFADTFPLRQLNGGGFSPVGAIGAVNRQSVEARLEHGGRRFDLLVSVGHLTSAQNGMLGSVVTLTDITERKLAEKALRKSEEEFRTLAESMPQIVWITRADGWTIYFNQQWMDYTGLTLEESLGHGWNKPFHPDDQQGAWDAWQKATATAGIYSIESRLRRADGTYRWWLVRGVPLKDAAGNIAKWFGTCTDIDDLKVAELNILNSREMFRHIAESTDAIPFTLDLTRGHFVYVGAQGISNSGIPESNWKEPGALDAILPRASNPELRQHFDECQTGPFEFVSAMSLPSNRHSEVRWTGTCEMVGETKILRGLMLDITELRRLSRQLQAAQKLESVGRLAAGIAHEINTPVQFVSDNVQFVSKSMSDIAVVIHAYRQLLHAVKSPGDVVAAAHAADEAEKCADLDYFMKEVPLALDSSVEGLGRIATIVRSMKEFAHPDSSQKIMADLNQAIRSTLVVARNEYKHIAELDAQFADLPAVMCHLGEVNQVVLNLLVNASHAIADVVKGTDTLGKLTVRTRLDGDAVEISIADTGTGIPAEIRDKVFDPFFTTKDVGIGTGQGLALAHSVIVKRHGGTLRFETECGKGSTFFIRLPIIAAADDRTQAFPRAS